MHRDKADNGSRGLTWASLLGLVAILAASGAVAQVAEDMLTIPAEIEVRGRGWSQALNVVEMLDFLLTLGETVLLTALLAFHPVVVARSRRTGVIDLQKGLFLFSLIGMLTGFLVVHHGYLIGFVIFGIGGLFRFRMETSSIPETAKLVIASLVGLAAGLDLPVMAVIATAAAWVVIYLFGRTERLALEVKFDEAAAPQVSMQHLQDHLKSMGYAIASVSKTKFKPVAEYVLVSRDPDAQRKLVNEMAELQGRKESGILDWHID